MTMTGCEKRLNGNVCKNETLLLNPNNKLKTLKINLTELNDSILKINGITLNCVHPKKHEFNIVLHNLKIKVYLERNCCNCIRKDNPTVSILANNKGKVLIYNEKDTIIDFKKIPKWFKDNYLVKKQRSIVFKEIGLGWSDNITNKNLNNVIQKIVDGYLICANKMSNDIYKKEICKLNTKELSTIIKELPFELRLINFNSDKITLVEPNKLNNIQ